MKYYQIKLFSCLSLSLLVAVSGYGARWQRAEKCADKKAQKKYYAMAADKYEHILTCKKLPADSAYTVHIKLANCYMKMENTIKAEANYAEAVKSGKADAMTTFNYARSLEANEKYADAKEWFDKVVDNADVKGKHAKGFSEISDKAAHSNKNDKFGINRLGFNTQASEYAPAYYKKGIAYTSNRNERFKPAQEIMWNNVRFTDIYTVQEDDKGDLRVTDKLPWPINSRLNDGACTFNAAGDEIFFTRNNKRRKLHDQLQILHSKFDGTNWSRPEVLSFEMPGTSYTNPSLSPDGNTFYFSSDLASATMGGMDIFMVKRNGTAWETPVNLGDAINTSGNETFPYVGADGTLYFTSDGWPGYGGMDIFHAKMKDGKYEKAENMGYEFNSSRDDLSLIIDTKNRTGYFASNRDGDDDIYSFRLPAKKSEENKDKEKQLEAMRTGKVIDKVTTAPLSGARVEVYKPSNPMMGMFYYTNDSGLFHFTKKIESEDQIKVTKENYRTNTLFGANISDAKNFEISMDSDLVVKPGARLDFTTLYYDLNKSNLTNTNLEMLRPVIDMMKSSPDALVYVSGYADERGSDTYNFGLSLRRVKEVIDFLTSQGVDMLKVRSAFFGAVKLSAKCRRNPACMQDTDRENRRVEIYITNQPNQE